MKNKSVFRVFLVVRASRKVGCKDDDMFFSFVPGPKIGGPRSQVCYPSFHFVMYKVPLCVED